MIVVGSPNSSNSNRLRELAERCGAKSYLIDAPEQINPEWLNGFTRIGVTAGASAPEDLVQQIVARLKELGADEAMELVGREENMHFALPKELRVENALEK